MKAERHRDMITLLETKSMVVKHMFQTEPH